MHALVSENGVPSIPGQKAPGLLVTLRNCPVSVNIDRIDRYYPISIPIFKQPIYSSRYLDVVSISVDKNLQYRFFASPSPQHVPSPSVACVTTPFSTCCCTRPRIFRTLHSPTTAPADVQSASTCRCVYSASPESHPCH